VYYELTDRFEVKSNLADTWRFFSTAENLPLITPPWLRFTITTPPPITIRHGTILDYTVRPFGFPLKWRTRIIDWSPPHQFIDLQVKGPYTLWHHQHRFTDAHGGGTLCEDRVIYRLPLGPLGRLFHPLTVRRQLFEIFRFRRKVISDKLGALYAVQDDVRIAAI
jgi:ligand-binding SRPBCC domain-containing protein